MIAALLQLLNQRTGRLQFSERNGSVTSVIKYSPKRKIHFASLFQRETEGNLAYPNPFNVQTLSFYKVGNNIRDCSLISISYFDMFGPHTTCDIHEISFKDPPPHLNG